MSDPQPSRRRFIGAALAAGACALLPPARATVASVVAVEGGRVAGTRIDGLHVFRGIRYGADTAPRRFRPAAPPVPWRGIRSADAFGANAPQNGAGGPGCEDCLFLNLWTPALDDGAKRPILVYVHGGGFDTGSGSDPLYDGGRLCRHGDAVVVTVNHRLNVFGYLALRDLGGAAFAQSGNIGQLDLVMALHWIRRHAARFGGDADNVTLFGQSGGGAKIATLMAMPAARGLFHRAWTMSGQQVTAAGPRAAMQRAQLFLDALDARNGAGPPRAEAAHRADVDFERLCALPATDLLAALSTPDPSRIEDTRLYFGPVMDGVSLPRHPFWPDAAPQSAAVPMVVGNTRDETRAFLGSDPAHFALTWATLPERLRTQQYVDLDPDGVVAAYRRMYPHYSPSDVFFAATTAGRSWRGAVETLEARARQGAPTWAYQLDWYPRTPEGERLRAFHTLDIPLVFDTVDMPGARTGADADARRMAATLRDALLAFARHGDPGHPGLPDWRSYSLERRETMVLDRRSTLQRDPRGGERELYRQAPFVQRGTF
ncbi:carboxylesterase/lipase family protein [Luteimonas abyssi]|uniref:carboxylesterase/lipase family protein n=1 Tax=Luteimonas abyssi TaxID=1247514 RepID=UPI000737BB02|nr:carboxylesterase/lipase family protein [Luteimonas abyssi]